MNARLLDDFSGIASDWFWEMDENLRFSFFSERFESNSGFNVQSVIGKTREQLSAVVDDDEADWDTHLADLAARRPFHCFVYKVVRDDGLVRRMSTSGRPKFDPSGRFTGYRGVATDVTEAYEAAETLERQNRDLRVKEATLDQVQRMASIGAWEIDLASGAVRWSEEVYNIYEVPTDMPISKELAEGRFEGKARHDLQTGLAHIAKTGGRIDETAPFLTMNGNRKWVRWIAESDRTNGRATRLFGTFQDVTEERERAAVMKRLAHTDSLTGLANRTVFQNVLRSYTIGKNQHAGGFLLFLIDIDHFKLVNDTYGHDAGDKVLRFAARQLSLVFSDEAVIARLGGDELAVIAPDPDVTIDPHRLAEQLRDAFTVPVSFRGDCIDLTVSVGIARGPDHGRTEQEIMRSADLALYRSKRSGRDRATLYRSGFASELNERSRLLSEFKNPATRKRIQPFYQPMVDLGSGRHLGFEALMRWNHPSGERLAPSAFGCVFEDTRAARIATEVMVGSVVENVAEWANNDLATGRVSINLAIADLRDDGFLEMFFSEIERVGLTPDLFGVEITEGVVLGGREEAILKRLQTLARAGVEIALDDFGIGFASLTHLQQLPISVVKIDQAFLARPDLNARDLAVLKAVIELGHALSYATLAEGIESADQNRFLQLMGVQSGQGHYFAEPMAFDDVPTYLLNRFVETQVPAQGPAGNRYPATSVIR
ncbi:MAG: EAL domain-containing protein [Pseudomonadota bacterium]